MNPVGSSHAAAHCAGRDSDGTRGRWPFPVSLRKWSPATAVPSGPALCRRTHRPPLLKAFTAEHGTPLRRAERNSRFLPTLRAGRFGLRPLEVALARGLRALGLTVLTPLGLVFEALVGKKHLFAGGENKLLTAFRTLQDLIVVFHMLLRDSALVAKPATPSA